MIDASVELQGAVVAKLKATAALTALIGQKVLDPVPANTVPPYVSFGPTQVLPDDFECIAGSEIFFQIDVWSDEPGFEEVKKIAGVVRSALHNQELTLTENALVSLELDSRRDVREPDGLISRSILTFRAVVEHD